jgi:hypothetical protein
VAATTTAPSASLEDRVLSRISFDWRAELPGWRIQFVGPRSGYRGSTFPDQRLIQVYVRSNSSLNDLVHVTAHELGHAVDVTLLAAEDREAWNVARGRSASAGWWVAPGQTDFSSGAGDWAESFAWSQTTTGGWYSEIGNPPTAEQLALLASIIG